MRCPRCGLELPAHARFCARCGARLAVAGPRPEPWVLVVFAVGIVLTACVATVYAAIAVYPSAQVGNLDPATLRTGAIILAGVLAAFCLIQAAAVAGLVRGHDWGRVTATIACVMWSLTCVGLPVAVFVLRSIWRTQSLREAGRWTGVG